MLTTYWQKLKYLAFSTTKQQAFLEDLATLIEDGVPAKHAVEIVAHASVGLSIEVANDILLKISEGKYLAEGMRGWFPDHIVEIVRAGEEGGALAKTMLSAAVSLTEKNSAMTSVIGSIAYPLAVIVMGSIVAIFINHSIFQTFRSILPAANWPGVGLDVADFASFVQNWWWMVLILCVAIGVAIAGFLRNYVGDARHTIDKFPVIAIYRQVHAARFMQTLGLLIANGVVFKKALKILQYSANPYLAWHLLTMEYRLGGGKENIAEVLDTGLIDSSDLARLRVIARGKGFEHALLRQGKYSLEQSTRSIKTTGRVTGGILLGCAALFAIVMILGIYTTGSSVAGY